MKNNQEFFFEPTIRRETNVLTLDEDVNIEKQVIYVHVYQIDNWEVKGLWFIARGTAVPFHLNLFKIHDFPKQKLVEMCLTMLKDTLGIIQYFLHS